MDVNWGKAPEMIVRPEPHGMKGVIQLIGNNKEAATGVLHWPDVWMTMLSKDQAKKLGAALIRVANSV